MNRAAQALGRRAKGVPKSFSAEYRAELAKRLATARKLRHPHSAFQRAVGAALRHLVAGDPVEAVSSLELAERVAPKLLLKLVQKARAEAECGSTIAAEVLLGIVQSELRRAAR